MKKILVTGASGFIGNQLVGGLLREDCIVRLLVRDSSRRMGWPGNVDVVVGDIRDVQEVRVAATGCDIVYHLAGSVPAIAEVHSDEALYQSINVEGARNVLEGAIAGGARSVVFFSSVKDRTNVLMKRGSLDPTRLMGGLSWPRSGSFSIMGSVPVSTLSVFGFPWSMVLETREISSA
jgi:nucleoside-diphosphate-sugar epimerase